jgi:hypothetical protein
MKDDKEVVWKKLKKKRMYRMVRKVKVERKRGE